MTRILNHPRVTALLVLIVSTALLGGAFLFQYVGGLAPCALCVWQRYPHGAAIALAALAVIVPAAARLPRAALLGLAGLVLLAGRGDRRLPCRGRIQMVGRPAVMRRNRRADGQFGPQPDPEAGGLRSAAAVRRGRLGVPSASRWPAGIS